MHGRIVVLTTKGTPESYTVEENVMEQCPAIDYIDENVLELACERNDLIEYLKSYGVKCNKKGMTTTPTAIAKFTLLDENVTSIVKAMDVIKQQKWYYPVYDADTNMFYESFLEFAYATRAWNRNNNEPYKIVALYDFHV